MLLPFKEKRLTYFMYVLRDMADYNVKVELVRGPFISSCKVAMKMAHPGEAIQGGFKVTEGLFHTPSPFFISSEIYCWDLKHDIV